MKYMRLMLMVALGLSFSGVAQASSDPFLGRATNKDAYNKAIAVAAIAAVKINQSKKQMDLMFVEGAKETRFLLSLNGQCNFNQLTGMLGDQLEMSRSIRRSNNKELTLVPNGEGLYNLKWDYVPISNRVYGNLSLRIVPVLNAFVIDSEESLNAFIAGHYFAEKMHVTIDLDKLKSFKNWDVAIKKLPNIDVESISVIASDAAYAQHVAGLIGEISKIKELGGFKFCCAVVPLNEDFYPMIADMGTLQKLDLTGSQFGAEGRSFLRLAKSIEGLNLKELILTDNGMTDVHTGPLAIVVKELPDLEVLDVSKNEISNGGAESLAVACRGLTHLRDLNLGDNQISNQGFVIVMAHLDGKESLIVLSLEGNPISDEGVVAVGKGMARLPGLEELNLSRTKLSAAGAGALAYTLYNSETIKRLGLKGLPLNERDVNVLNEMLPQDCEIVQ